MAANQKCMETILQLTDKVSKWVAAAMPIVTSSFDANGNPTVTFSADATPATGEKVVVITVKPYATGTATDVFGNTAIAFVPTVIQVCTESNYAGTTDNVADYLAASDLLPVLIEVGRTGCIVEWHQTANGTVPSAAAIAAGTVLKATWKPLYWGIQSAS